MFSPRPWRTARGPFCSLDRPSLERILGSVAAQIDPKGRHESCFGGSGEQQRQSWSHGCPICSEEVVWAISN